MTKLAVMLAVCLVGSMVMGMMPVYDKPYYDLENVDVLFHVFLKQNRKQYSPKEYLERLEIFKESLKDVNRRNAKYLQTVFAVNRFADLKPEERQQYRGLNLQHNKLLNETRVKVTFPDSSVAAPQQFDWRDKGKVSYVKDQYECLSSFIFSAVGNIEGQHAIKHNYNYNAYALSEQQALSCLKHGTCDGGIVHQVMQEFAKRAGVMREKDYPYNPFSSRHCREDANKMFAHVLGGHEINIPDTLMKKLVDIGPLAVGLAADDLDSYKSGILHPDLCTGKDVNHFALLVGYGVEYGQKYLLLKNSWGKDWGEEGYFRLVRGVNACKMGTGYTASATVA